MTDTESSKETAAKAMKGFDDASHWISQYVRMNAELLQTALKSATPLINAWGNWYQSFLPVQMKVAAEPRVSHSGPCVSDKSCCEIPETGCPPGCACTVRWDASTGQRPCGNDPDSQYFEGRRHLCVIHEALRELREDFHRISAGGAGIDYRSRGPDRPGRNWSCGDRPVSARVHLARRSSRKRKI